MVNSNFDATMAEFKGTRLDGYAKKAAELGGAGGVQVRLMCLAVHKALAFRRAKKKGDFKAEATAFGSVFYYDKASDKVLWPKSWDQTVSAYNQFYTMPTKRPAWDDESVLRVAEYTHDHIRGTGITNRASALNKLIDKYPDEAPDEATLAEMAGKVRRTTTALSKAANIGTYGNRIKASAGVVARDADCQKIFAANPGLRTRYLTMMAGINAFAADAENFSKATKTPKAPKLDADGKPKLTKAQLQAQTDAAIAELMAKGDKPSRQRAN